MQKSNEGANAQKTGKGVGNNQTQPKVVVAETNPAQTAKTVVVPRITELQNAMPDRIIVAKIPSVSELKTEPQAQEAKVAVAQTGTAQTALGVGKVENQPTVAVAQTGTAQTTVGGGNSQAEAVVVVGKEESQQVVNEALSIEKLQQQLENQLRRISYKNEIAKNRERFLATKKDLTQVKTFMEKENLFESNGVKIVFKAPIAGYERDGFSIANTELILKFIDVLSAEIDVKVKEIETKLINE